MRTGGGHAKGASFERETCKKLSRWLTNGERDDCLWRTAMSGGRATLQFRQGQINKSQVGDVSMIDQIGALLTDRFVFECKFHEELNFVGGFLSDRGKLHAFWKKLVADADKTDKFPILICKENYVPSIIVMEPESSRDLKLGDPILSIPRWNAEIYLFEEFLKTAKVPNGVDHNE
jgi:hypothetical protein